MILDASLGIYGKDTCPYTNAARDVISKEGKEIEYFDVQLNPKFLEEMLKLSNGQRKVPVIVENGNVSVGFRGKSWGVWRIQLDAEVFE